jgi:hypothetical protein
MHIAATTHEHGASARVYSYEGDYEIGDDSIRWQAAVAREGERRSFSGSIPLSSPSIATLAEQAVRDAILQRIDAFDDAQEEGGG